MEPLELPIDRTALLVVELQNDIVHEANIGQKGFRGVLAAQAPKRGVLPKVRALTDAAPAAGVPVAYVNYARKPDFPRPNTLLHRRTAAEPTLIEGTWGAETHAAVAPAAQDFVFTRCVAADGPAVHPAHPSLSR